MALREQPRRLRKLGMREKFLLDVAQHDECALLVERRRERLSFIERCLEPFCEVALWIHRRPRDSSNPQCRIVRIRRRQGTDRRTRRDEHHLLARLKRRKRLTFRGR
jgi:hypothetical protein